MYFISFSLHSIFLVHQLGLPEVWLHHNTYIMLSVSGEGEETMMTKRESGLSKMKGSFGTKPHDSKRNHQRDLNWSLLSHPARTAIEVHLIKLLLWLCRIKSHFEKFYRLPLGHHSPKHENKIQLLTSSSFILPFKLSLSDFQLTRENDIFWLPKIAFKHDKTKSTFLEPERDFHRDVYWPFR